MMSVISRPCLRFAAGALLLLALPGCQRAHVAPAKAPAAALSSSPRTAPARIFTAIGVHSLPAYHKAEAACRGGRYGEAADLLARLGSDTRLSAEYRAFCREQQAICLRDAGLPVPASASVLPAVSTVPIVSAASLLRSLTPEQADCGPRALRIVCERLDVRASLPALRQMAGTTGQGTSMAGLASAAEKLGLKAEGMQVSREALSRIETPALAWVNQNHYVAVLSLKGDGPEATALVHDPNQSGEQTIGQEQLLRLCGGYLLLVHR